MSRPLVERTVPYQSAHDRSVVRAMRKGHVPQGLNALIAWYISAWELETPMRLHVPGTWHDPEAHTQLGSPQDDPAWRSYLYGGDDALDADGYYLRPLHAALLRLGRHVDRDGEYPFMAVFLVRLAFGRFDWEGVGAAHGMERGAAATYTKAALTHLWERWTPQPMVR